MKRLIAITLLAACAACTPTQIQQSHQQSHQYGVPTATQMPYYGTGGYIVAPGIHQGGQGNAYKLF